VPILPLKLKGLYTTFKIYFYCSASDLVSHGHPTSLQQAHPLLGVCGNTTVRGTSTCLNYFVLFIVYTIYKCRREPHDKSRCGAGFETHVVSYFVLISTLCHMTHQQIRLVCARRFSCLSCIRVTTWDWLAHK